MKNTDKSSRLRFLETLNSMTEGERTRLLEIEDFDELAELFCLCHSEYGAETDVFKTLARITWNKTPCDTMEQPRYEFLSAYPGDDRTAAEKAEGWHFCREFDGLLVGPGMGELEHCRCLVKEHPMYKKSTGTK